MNPLRAILSNFESERQRWSYWLPLAMQVGIIAYFALPFEPAVEYMAALPVLALAAWLVREKSWPAAVALFVVFIASLGFAAAQIETMLDKRPMLDGQTETVTISGYIASTDIMPDGLRLILLTPSIEGIPAEKTPESVRLKFKELTLDDAPETGSRIEVYGQLSAMSESVAPDAPNFRRQAYFKHLGGIGWSYGEIKVDANAPALEGWRERMSFAMERARKTLAKHVYARLSGDVAAMTAARLNGEQTGISDKAADDMRIAGLTHLLSTSGFNVTLMALLIYFPLRAFFALIPWIALRYPIKKWAAGAAVFSAVGYTFLVGSQAATLRSLLMTGLAMLAIVSDRRADPLRLVMLSAALCMLFVPSATLGASFQLSVAAVLCLIAASEARKGKTENGFLSFLPNGIRPLFGNLSGIFFASIIATAATTPFSLYHFQSFSLYGFAANMVAIPISSFWIMPAVLFAYFLAPFGWDGLFIDAAGIGTAATMRIASIVSAWPHAIFYWPAMPSAVLGVITLGGLWVCLWRKRWRYAGLLPVIIGMLYPLYTRQPDFFVSPDGKFWAARLEDGRLAVNNSKKGRFAVEQWQRMLGNVDAVDAAGLSEDDPWMKCDALGCVYRRSGQIIAMPSADTAAAEDCAKADIVIAPFAISDCAAQVVIDEQALTERGAHVLYFDADNVKIRGARSGRGKRMWEGEAPPPT